jgi:preprotein translocase subunit SecA
VYRTSKERDEAVISQIENCQKNGQPVLVGTVSIEKSELLSTALTQRKIAHKVLNARFHEEEAKIISLAGCARLLLQLPQTWRGGEPISSLAAIMKCV